MSEREAQIAGLPIWQGPLRCEPLHGGLSNESFAVTDSSGRYVVRFGADYPFHHVSREREVMAARAAHAAGLAPEVIFAAPGVMVSRFIEAATYGPADLLANLSRVTALLRRYHEAMPVEVSGPGYLFWVFHVVRDYARALAGSRLAARLPEFLALNAELEAAQVPLPIVYGHHDLLPANLLDDGKRLWLIDFEYAGFGTPAFDLASLAQNGGFGEAEVEELLTLYFDHEPDEALRRAQAAMQCATLLRESLWSLVSELHLDTPGIDYPAYSQENLTALEAALAAYRAVFGKA
ncbi:MAG: phosphotransferase family protein [Rhodospirillales bacterium]